MDDYKTVKIALVGVAAVGKTSLAKMFTNDTISNLYEPTIGADMRYVYDINNSLKLAIWDLAGMPRFISLVQPFIKNTNIIILCYNSNDFSTLEQLRKLYRRYIAKNVLHNKKLIVVATMMDLTDDFLQKEGQCFAEEIGGIFFKTSAKNMQGREEIMRYFRKKIQTVKFINDIEFSPDIKSTHNEPKKYCKCLLYFCNRMSNLFS